MNKMKMEKETGPTITIRFHPDVKKLWDDFKNGYPFLNKSAVLNELLRIALPRMGSANPGDLREELAVALKGLQSAGGGTTEGQALHSAEQTGAQVAHFAGYSQPTKFPKAKVPVRKGRSNRSSHGAK